MIVQRDFLNKLKDFGLNSYESKLWAALLSRGIATAGELSDIANVPRSRCYDVLESLERKGFVMMKLGKPIKYLAVSPADVLERVKKNIHEELQRRTETIDGMRASELIDSLTALYKQGIEGVDPTECSGAIKGQANVYAHLAEHIKNAKSSVLLCTTAQGLSRKAESLYTALRKAKNRGVAIKILAPHTPAAKDAIESLKDCAQLQNAPGNSLRFCVIDSKQATLLALDDEKAHPHYDFGIWVNTPHFAGAMERLFEKLWADAR